MTTLSDEQLLADHLKGQCDGFELLVRRYAQELFHFAYRLMGSAAAAEDVVQETFLQLHLSAASFDSRRKLRPWLFTIAANKARDLLRSQKRRPQLSLEVLAGGDAGHTGPPLAELLSDHRASPSLAMEAEERSYRLRQLVDQLPTHLREVLVLGYYHGFAYKDMAEMLGLPLGTIKSRLHTAVARFGELHAAEEEARNSKLETRKEQK